MTNNRTEGSTNQASTNKHVLATLAEEYQRIVTFAHQLYPETPGRIKLNNRISHQRH